MSRADWHHVATTPSGIEEFHPLQEQYPGEWAPRPRQTTPILRFGVRVLSYSSPILGHSLSLASVGMTTTLGPSLLYRPTGLTFHGVPIFVDNAWEEGV